MIFFPSGKTSFQFKEKRSRFIACLRPLSGPSQAANILKEFKTEFPAANHITWAYRLKDGNNFLENSSDAGEPSGCAGQPLLQQLKKHQLSQAMVVVVRYFGGIKLGKKGLSAAFGRAAQEVMNQAVLLPWVEKEILDLNSTLELYGPVIKLAGRFQGQILNDYSASELGLQLEFKKTDSLKFQNEIQKQALKVEIKKRVSANQTKEGKGKGVG